MKKLLDGRLPEPNGGQTNSTVAGMPLALSNISRDISEYLKWCRTDVKAVAADHWLVSYLIIATSKIGYHHELPPRASFTRSDFATEELARAFGFTTEYNAGRLHIGDNGAVTIYIVGQSPRRKEIDANTPWWSMTAMRFLAHSSTSLSLGNHADPEEFIGSGFDVIEIDLAILHYQAVQFMRYWSVNAPDKPRSIQMMVAMDVLPRLKLSQYDIAIMNRMTAVAKGFPISKEQVRLSKSFPDRTPEMDRALAAQTHFLLGRDMPFETAIASLPFTLNNNPFKVLSLDDYSYSRAINWAVLIARYGLLDYLFAICRVDPERSGRYPVNDIVRTIKRIEGDNGLAQTLSSSARRDFKEKLAEILALSRQ